MTDNSNKMSGFGGLAALCLLLILALIRCTYLETAEFTDNLSIVEPFSQAKSLITSTAIFLISSGVIIYGLVSKKQKLLKTSFEPFFVLFVIINACLLLRAGDKESALVNSLTLACPVLMGVAIVNLCSDLNKAVLVLIIIAAAGAVNTVQCFDQAFLSKDMMLQQYQQNPQEQLEKLGIEKDTLQHFLYEHRLHSKGVSGFFRTANVAGSFFILTSFAALYLLYCFFDKKNLGIGFCLILLFGINLFGLFLTHSKGAILSAIISFIGAGVYLKFANLFSKYKGLLITAAAIIIAGLVLFFTAYGIKNQTLPCGKSMHFRWQYWQASAEMIKDFPFGVGAGNFGNHYAAYKDPAAIETITAPHNFIINGYCQFGIIGFTILLACLGLVFNKIFKSATYLPNKSFAKPAAGALISIIILAGLLRVGFIQAELTNVPDVMLYLALVYYVVPAAVLILAVAPFLVKTPNNARIESSSIGIIVCGVLGVILHNIIDLAFFEPAVWTVFWIMLAVSLAIKNNLSVNFLTNYRITNFRKIAAVICLVGLCAASIYYGVFVSVKVASNLSRAFTDYRILFSPPTMIWQQNDKYIQKQQLDKTIYYLDNAISANPMSSFLLSLKGKMLYQAVFAEKADIENLYTAKNSFAAALVKNPYNYKDYESLAEISDKLAQLSPQKKERNLQAALDYLMQAVKLFPASERINYKIAYIGDQLGLEQVAAEYYRKTIEIEDAYLEEFKAAFKDEPVVWRVGKEKYEYARNRLLDIEKL